MSIYNFHTNLKKSQKELFRWFQQRTILCPLLFITYINDLPDIRWCAAIKLFLKHDKTQNLIFSRKEIPEVYSSECVTFLCVYLDSQLIWATLLIYAKNQQKHLHLSEFVFERVLKEAYFSTIRCHMSHPVIAWGHCSVRPRQTGCCHISYAVIAWGHCTVRPRQTGCENCVCHEIQRQPLSSFYKTQYTYLFTYICRCSQHMAQGITLKLAINKSSTKILASQMMAE